MSLVAELRRRHVVKVAVAYAIVGWLLIEVTSTVLPTFEAPQWVLQTITFVIILGFPLALVLSWVFDLTPQGVKRTTSAMGSGATANVSGRKLDFAIIGALVLALGFVVYNYVLDDVDMEMGVLPNSIAVLPFENFSPDPDNAYFAAGMHEEILNQLVTLRNLSVISRTSVVRYANSNLSIPEIADELNVQTIMEGSVRYAGNRVRIAAQLIDSSTDEHLWSDVYERDLADIFGIQSDIAMNIANALEAEFSIEEQERIERIPTSSPEAYDLYIRAGQIGGDVGLAYLDQAIDLDPNFAEAYTLRGGINGSLLVGDLGREETLTDRLQIEALVRADLERALDLDPNIGQAYAWLAYLYERNWRGVEAAEIYERAYQLIPNEVSVLRNYARFKMWTDQAEEAISLATRATELAPNDARAFRMLGIIHEHVGSLDEAYNAFYTARSLSPAGTAVDQLNVARIEFLLGHLAEAQREFRLFEPMALDSNNSVFLAVLAYGYSRLGLEEDAVRVLASYDERAADRTIASASYVIANLARNDEERALEWINTAAEIRDLYLGQALIMRIRINAFRDPILDRPEFVTARERLGFTEL